MRTLILAFSVAVCLAVLTVGCSESTRTEYTSPHENEATADFKESADASIAPTGDISPAATSSRVSTSVKKSRVEVAPDRDRFDAGLVKRADRTLRDTSRKSRTDEKSKSETVLSETESDSSSASRQSNYQSGILTAGSLDDNANYQEYRQYLSRAMQHGTGSWQLNIGQRIVIKVVDGENHGVGAAKISIREVQNRAGNSDQHRGRVFQTKTGSDGTTLFLSSIDLVGAGQEFEMTVSDPISGETVTQRFSKQEDEWTITLPESRSNLPTRLDLALVIDTTGSMTDELEYLKAEIDRIAESVRLRFPNVDQRYALILYRDEGDRYLTRTFDFTNSLGQFQKSLSQQRAAGGGDYPEAMHISLEQSALLSWRDKNTARVLFLVGDAPPHDHFFDRTFKAINQLRSQQVTVFPIAASGAGDGVEFVMRHAAFVTSGQYLFLTDHSGVGNAHSRPQATRYNVEHLDQLMLRMIASELAGRALLPQEIISTEHGPSQPFTSPVLEQRQQTNATPVVEFNTPTAQASIAPTFPFGLRWCLIVVGMMSFFLLDRFC